MWLSSACLACRATVSVASTENKVSGSFVVEILQQVRPKQAHSGLFREHEMSKAASPVVPSQRHILQRPGRAQGWCMAWP